jgi:hypothetical protein
MKGCNVHLGHICLFWAGYLTMLGVWPEMGNLYLEHRYISADRAGYMAFDPNYMTSHSDVTLVHDFVQQQRPAAVS